MASPTTPQHGKLAALYILRPNGFNGDGLNDATWGTAATNAASSYYEVVIDGVGTGIGGVDEFKWRKNGGAWTENVDITGAAQILDEAQTITFAATTGHTLTDQWVIGNLVAEATTEATNTAQITDATKRLLNPNATVTFTDDGGKAVRQINYTNGSAVFSGNVGNVTVAGNNAWIPAIALQKVGYLVDWSLNVNLDMADASRCGQQWKESLPGQAGGSGSANGYFIATETLLNNLVESLSGDKYQLLQLFNYDPDQDQTGDHHNAWATFTSFSPNGTINDVVKESVNFQVTGPISFTANA